LLSGNPTELPFQIRLAMAAEIPALKTLIELSVRTLQAGDYSPEQMDGALGTVLGVDSQLVADGTYFVAVAGEQIVGCGGWSKRRTLFGSDHGPGREDAFLDPLTDRAKIRAFFIHPEWARRGVGSAILRACENAAVAAGFAGFELGATLTGEKLFRVRGYQTVERIEVPLANGLSLPVIRMAKAF
jgi:GNAT superfamily N-acetyltransferase